MFYKTRKIVLKTNPLRRRANTFTLYSSESTNGHRFSKILKTRVRQNKINFKKKKKRCTATYGCHSYIVVYRTRNAQYTAQSPRLKYVQTTHDFHKLLLLLRITFCMMSHKLHLNLYWLLELRACPDRTRTKTYNSLQIFRCHARCRAQVQTSSTRHLRPSRIICPPTPHR